MHNKKREFKKVSGRKRVKSFKKSDKGRIVEILHPMFEVKDKFAKAEIVDIVDNGPFLNDTAILRIDGKLVPMKGYKLSFGK